MDKYALMGKEAQNLIDKEQGALVSLFHNYYGLNIQGKAHLLDEISQAIGRADVSQLKRNLEEYIQLYRLNLVAEEMRAL